MNTEKVMVSAFCLTTNCLKNHYPVIESIKSWLPVVDELVVIDGGSTDGTVEAIEAIGDDKIRIIQDDDVKWEDDWAYCRMGHNFTRGFEECQGDWAIKFDVDYILHESSWDGIGKKRNLRGDFLSASTAGKTSIGFTRMNFILGDRFYVKSKKTLAMNKTECTKQKIRVKYGLDLIKWGWGFEPVIPRFKEQGIWFGDMIRTRSTTMITCATVYNYDYTFKTEKVAKIVRQRHYLAEARQQNKIYKKADVSGADAGVQMVIDDPGISWTNYKNQCIKNLSKFCTQIDIEKHPEIIRDKIMALNPRQQGFNAWGWAGVDKINYL